MRHYLFIFFLILPYIAHSQTIGSQSDTVFNQTDKQGHKQGYWKVKYDNGPLKYSAFFKDDKPLGLMKRYFEDGTLKAVMFSTRQVLQGLKYTTRMGQSLQKAII